MATLASLDLLRNVPVFSGLAERHLEAIVRCCRLTSVRAGTEILTAGQPSAALHVLLAGQVRVVDERGAEGIVPIDVLGKGAHLGEASLDGTLSPFTVQSITDTDLLTLSREDQAELKAAWPEIGAVPQRSRGARRRSPATRP